MLPAAHPSSAGPKKGVHSETELCPGGDHKKVGIELILKRGAKEGRGGLRRGEEVKEGKGRERRLRRGQEVKGGQRRVEEGKGRLRRAKNGRGGQWRVKDARKQMLSLGIMLKIYKLKYS